MVDLEQRPDVRPTRRVVTPDEEVAVSRHVNLGLMHDQIAATLRSTKAHSRQWKAAMALMLAFVGSQGAQVLRAGSSEQPAVVRAGEKHEIYMPFTGQSVSMDGLPTPRTAPMSTATGAPPSATPTEVVPPTAEPTPEPTRNTEIVFPAGTLVGWNSSRDVLARPSTFSKLGVEPKGIATGAGTGWILDSYGTGVAYRFLHADGYFEVATDDLGTIADDLPGLDHEYTGPRDDIETVLMPDGTRFIAQRNGQSAPLAQTASGPENNGSNGTMRSITAEAVAQPPLIGPVSIISPLVDRVESPEGSPITHHFTLKNAYEMFMHLGYPKSGEDIQHNWISVMMIGQQVFLSNDEKYVLLHIAIPPRNLSGNVTLSADRSTATWVFTDENGEQASYEQVLARPMNDDKNLTTLLVHTQGATGAEGGISAAVPPDANRFNQAKTNTPQGRDLQRVETLLEEQGSLRNVHPNMSLPLSGVYVNNGTTGITNLTPRSLDVVRQHAHSAFIDPAAVAGSWGPEFFEPGTDGIYWNILQNPSFRPYKDGQLQRLSSEMPITLFMKLQLGRGDYSYPIPNEARGPEILNYIIAYHEGSELSPNLSTGPDGFFDGNGAFGPALKRIHRDPKVVIDQIAAGIGHEWNATPVLDRSFVPTQGSMDEIERVLDGIDGAPIQFTEIVVSAVAPAQMNPDAYYQNLMDLRDRLAARGIGLAVRDVGCGVMRPSDAMALTRGVSGQPARLMLCWPGDALFRGRDQNALFKVVTREEDPARAFRLRLTPQLQEALGGL